MATLEERDLVPQQSFCRGGFALLTFKATLASGPKKNPATVGATSFISDNVWNVCPIALVIGALPIAAPILVNSLAAALTDALLQEQVPLMQEVDGMVLDLGSFGHEQSDNFLHFLGLERERGR
jgi:hypothetical protein